VIENERASRPLTALEGGIFKERLSFGWIPTAGCRGLPPTLPCSAHRHKFAFIRTALTIIVHACGAFHVFCGVDQAMSGPFNDMSDPVPPSFRTRMSIARQLANNR
jgi:hypothetical protein